MINADEWSRAISDWVMDQAESSGIVHLSLTQEVLGDLGLREWGLDDGFDSFVSAVRRQLRVNPNDGWTETHLVLPPSERLPLNGPPTCTAFLTLLVLAAVRSGDEVGESTGGEAFFPHLKLALGGEPTRTRSGLGELSQGSPEVALWGAWHRYVKSLGFKSSSDGYTGNKRNWGHALEQAILTLADERYLASPACSGSDVRYALMSARNGRYCSPAAFSRRQHLAHLWEKRWQDPEVQTAVENALDRLPTGGCPVQRSYERRERQGRICYVLKLALSKGWNGSEVRFGPIIGLEHEFTPGVETSLTVRPRHKGPRAVRWGKRYYRFVESETDLSDPASGRLPDLGEEHWLLLPRSNLNELEEQRDRNHCKWKAVVEVAPGWVELQAFVLEVPFLDQPFSGSLRTSDAGSIRFVGGARADRPGSRTPILIQGESGSIVSEHSLRATINRSAINITAEIPYSLTNLEVGDHELVTAGRMSRFSIVPWDAVESLTPVPEGWI